MGFARPKLHIYLFNELFGHGAVSIRGILLDGLNGWVVVRQVEAAADSELGKSLHTINFSAVTKEAVKLDLSRHTTAVVCDLPAVSFVGAVLVIVVVLVIAGSLVIVVLETKS